MVGIKHGYSKLIDYNAATTLQCGTDYVEINHEFLKRSRNSQGILIGTSRSNPGKNISHPDHFEDPELSAQLKNVYDGLRSLNVDALVSIGGDDTLKTANKFKMYQDRLPADQPRIPIVHLPKTIDNDYKGIDFTFGYFTAVDTLATEVRNLIYDAEAASVYFLAETMGRSAGWLAYGAAIAGEASLAISVEDITGPYLSQETYTNPETQKEETRKIMNIDAVIERILKTMQARDEEGKPFGVIIIAEGLAEYLPYEYLEGIPRDDHGHISIAHVNLARLIASLIGAAYQQATGTSRKVTGLQLGYETRCSKPHAFDVMLGSQLGVGAYIALVEKQLNGVMVSVSGQLDLHYVPFEELVDPQTLVTVVRYIDPNSDFHRLARFLETYVND